MHGEYATVSSRNGAVFESEITWGPKQNKKGLHPEISGVARGGGGGGGAARLEWHHMMWNHNFTDLRWRPYIFILFGLQPHLDQNPTNFTAKTFFFFFFGLHLILDQKRVAPRNLTQGAIVPSNASARNGLFFCSKPRKTPPQKKKFYWE